MEDLKQRRVLKTMMWEVFEELVDYQENMYRELENRIFDEVKNFESHYDIKAAIVKRERLDLLDGYLFPLKEEDREEKIYDKQEILEKIKTGSPVVITKLFLMRPYPDIKKLIDEKRTFSGTIYSEGREVPILISLRHNKEYIKEEAELYNVFMENSVTWKTPYNPYIRKFFNVVIINSSEEVSDLTDFDEIKFNFEEFDDDKYLDYVPVWNIEKTYQKGEGFPLPAEDKVNYEHILSFEAMGVGNGYLLSPDNLNIISKKMTETSLNIISDESDSVEWKIYKVIQKNKLENEEFEFQLLSNKRDDLFVNRFFHKRDKVIRTFSEVNRMINSFKVVDEIKLDSIEIKEEVPEETFTYDYNVYIIDEIRTNKYRKIMLLKFESSISGNLRYDLLSFLVSEIQMYFPEYIVKGVFI